MESRELARAAVLLVVVAFCGGGGTAAAECPDRPLARDSAAHQARMVLRETVAGALGATTCAGPGLCVGACTFSMTSLAGIAFGAWCCVYGGASCWVSVVAGALAAAALSVMATPIVTFVAVPLAILLSEAGWVLSTLAAGGVNDPMRWNAVALVVSVAVTAYVGAAVLVGASAFAVSLPSPLRWFRGERTVFGDSALLTFVSGSLLTTAAIPVVFGPLLVASLLLRPAAYAGVRAVLVEVSGSAGNCNAKE